MPIRTSPVPADAMEALWTGLGQMDGAAEIQTVAAISSGHEASWQEGVPQPIYHLGLDAIASGRGLDAAEPIGWRYLLGQTATPPTIAADVLRAPAGQSYVFAGLNQGPFVGQMLEVLRRTGRDPKVSQGDFEPRMLRVPALYIVALWLKERSPWRDILIPLEPSHPALTPGLSYTVAEFEAALRRAAEEQRSAAPAGSG